jgi:serine/threonine protein kinase
MDAPPASGYIPKSTLPNAGSSANHKLDPLAQLGGQVFGHYQIGPLLGRGFTAAVYMAGDKNNNDHTVALKVLAPEFPAAPGRVGPLRQGAQGGGPRPAPAPRRPPRRRAERPALLDRPGVRRGESAAAVVTRVADGEKISWARACRVAAHLARALEAVHGSGRVHGNITPRNVLMRHDDHTAKLADLMFAQAVEGSQLKAQTADKKRAMEVGYMAPEQVEAGAFVDRLADLYAVGAVTYALLTGRAPHIGATPKDVEASVKTGRVAKPTAYHKKVPATFEAVVLKLLAKKQEDRYQTAGGLLEDLTAIAEDHGLSV